MLDALVCPTCKINLTKKNEILFCRHCNLTFTNNEGIYDFLDDIDSSCLEFFNKDMDKLLNNAKKIGWRAAVREIGFKYPYINEIFLNTAKVDWLFHCLDFSKTSSCLELGSDWGTTTFCLAKYYNEVWSFDFVRQKLEFQRIRQNQDKINNIKFGRASWLLLPFPENHFDLIVAKNYIDGLNFDTFSKKPRTVQLKFLKEIRRVLKPSGCVYIGSPNKIRFSSLFREKNYDQSTFPYDLREKIEDLPSKSVFKKNNKMKNELAIKQFQILNYSLFGYKKILKEAGFSNIEFYWTIDHNLPYTSGRLNDGSFNYLLNLDKKQKYNSKSLRFLIPLIATHLPRTLIEQALPFASPSFLIFAYKDYKDITFESKLFNMETTVPSYLRRSGSRGAGSKIIYFLLKNGRPYSLFKFPRLKESSSLILEEERMSSFNKIVIKRKDVDSIIVFKEPFLKGTSMDYYNISQNKAILNWLMDFQKQTQKGFWDFNIMKIKVESMNQFLSNIPIDDKIRFRTRQKLKSFSKILSEIKLPLNSEHGDFSAVNIIISDNNKVYVTDWEFYNDAGDPLFDFVFFILCCSSDIKPFPQTYIDSFNGKGRYAQIIKILIQEFCEAKKLPIEIIFQAVPYVLLRLIYRTSFETDNKQLLPSSYITLLELWDKINSPLFPL